MAELHVVGGPMFSGKSEECRPKCSELQAVGISVALVRPIRDTRSEDLVTHSGKTLECIQLGSLSDLFAREEYGRCLCIAIDEAQFFDDLIPAVQQMLDDGKKIYAYGLSGTAEQKPFGHFLELEPLADTYVRKVAMCQFCRVPTPAPFTVCDVALPESKILPGGAEIYSSVCRKHLRS